jgi:cell division septum initiation protein DivIVA
VGPFGYNRSAVDQYVGELERELEDLRSSRPEPAVSITQEIERLGEQTASILVVAHDQANETTRRAQEQADRCIADAAANAVSITTQAREQLRELDSETDAVWQERHRLIDDARGTAAALIALADNAAERFPEDDKPTIDAPAPFAE